MRGIGATIALPFLEAMVSAAPAPARLVCIEMVHGSAGSTAKGGAKNLWAPAAIGSDFDLKAGSLSSLEPYRRYLTIVSNTDCRAAESTESKEAAGDHARSSRNFSPS